MAENAPFPPLAEMPTAAPCEGVAGKVSCFLVPWSGETVHGQRRCWNCNQPADADIECRPCADKIVERVLNPVPGGAGLG